MTQPKHFLDLDRFSEAELRTILDLSTDLKSRGRGGLPLQAKTLAMIFEKPSTRTRVSFEVAMKQLGGEAIVLNANELQIGRGETIADTARVLSRYVDVIMLRTDEPKKLYDLAEYATVPVINGLTDRSHPVQLLADIMTYEEHIGPIGDARIAWCGDGNNMALTWLQAATLFGFELRLACPNELSLDEEDVAYAKERGAHIVVSDDPISAVKDADCVVTDTWVSMGDEAASRRLKILEPFRVCQSLMEHAAPEAIFMHCLPAHRGEEVEASVLEGVRSVVWDEAENRLHAQKGLLMWCLSS
ncbi:MAG: ornithine carbamoyltransferase [Rhodospirillaceae bacterium]|jgi:ornithine carbamoyltransferase